jgi:16S rRNA (guanine527-N7)-methyltransferase
MDRTRIAELLQPFLAAPIHAPKTREAAKPDCLSAAKLGSISIYIDILLRWNSRINLTAIRDPEEIVTRHFGESLFLARVLFPALEANRQRPTINEQPRPESNHHLSVADVGSGAGFPGIPLRLWAPTIHLTLIESNHKKATFLREVVRALTLTDIDIQNTRAETLPHASFDLLTLRAVEHFESILPTAASLVKPNGRLALLVSTSQLDAARSVAPDVRWSLAAEVPQSQSRIVVIGSSSPVSTE